MVNTPNTRRMCQKDSGFILGSGFSAAATSGVMPVTNQIPKKLDPQLNEGLDFLLDNFTFEEALTFLSTPHPFVPEDELFKNKSKYFELARGVANVLRVSEEKSISSACEKGHADWLLDLTKKWHAQETPVVTLNYDTIVEHYASQVSELPYKNAYQIPLLDIDARSGAGSHSTYGDDDKTLKLYKLHGSLNWLYSGNDQFAGEQIYYDQESPQNQEKRAMNRKGLIPLIVPPVSSKHSFFNHPSLKEQWKEANTELSQISYIYCMGYSFPKEDMTFRTFLVRNLSLDDKGRSLVIVDRDEATAQKISERVKEFLVIPYLRIGFFRGPVHEFAKLYSMGESEYDRLQRLEEWTSLESRLQDQRISET